MVFKNFAKLFKVVLYILIAASALTEQAWAQATDLNYTNTKTIRLRDNNLKNPQLVDAGSEISIAPEFLSKALGTQNPTQDQIQQLLLNPEEATHNQVVTQSFFDQNSGSYKNDYFFPVIVKTKNGDIKKGKMAFQAYYRSGTIEAAGTSGSDPRTKDFIAQNRKITEADICTSCSQNTKPSNLQNISQLRQAIVDNTTSSTHSLWIRYNNFARDFTNNNKNINKSRAGYYKRLYVKNLIEEFGPKEAGIILATLTGYAESPYRENIDTQIAEIAAVLKVIENRTQNNYNTRSKTLKDIGISSSVDARISTVLADWQFSAWNDKDNNLPRILNYNPDNADNVTKRRLAMAFEAQKLMQQGNIEFLGNMNNPQLQHYHANYVSPSWSRASKRVAPKVKIYDTVIDLSKQRGSRHVFYAEIT